MAVDFLWKWTGQRFGNCEITVRPCKQTCYDGLWSWPIISLTGAPLLSDTDVPLFTDEDDILTAGSMGIVGSHCGACRNECSCTVVHEVLLPGPVLEVTEILINGEELPLSMCRIDDYCRLVRLDGREWPICQDISAAYDAPGAWAVTYRRSQPVPPGGGLAAGALAVELAKAYCNDSSCRLPKRTTTITRQGVTTVFFDSFTDLQAGRTGIWEVDSWVNTQIKPRAEGVVRSPDLRKPRMTTWTYSPTS